MICICQCFNHLSDIKKSVTYTFKSISSNLFESNILLWNEGSHNDCIILNAMFECCVFWLWCSFSQGILKKEGHNFLIWFLTFFDFCIVFNSHSFGDAVQHSHHRPCIQELRLQLWHERKSNGKRLMSAWTFLWSACCALTQIRLVTTSVNWNVKDF